MKKCFLLPLMLAAMLFGEKVEAQITIVGPTNPLTITTAEIEFQLPGAPLYEVPQGSSFSLDVDLFLSDNTDSITGFSFTVPAFTDLTYSGFTPALPAGWTFSDAGDSVQATNATGANLPGADGVTVGDVTFKVDPNAPVGTSLTIPSPGATTINDANHEALNYLGGGYIYQPTVTAAPEPRSFWLAVLALGIFGLARCYRPKRS